MELMERIKTAEGAGEQRELLEAAFNALFPLVPGDPERNAVGGNGFWDFKRKLDAEAYESAALMLVPEGWSKVIAEKRGLPAARRWEVWLHDHNTPDGISVRHVEANAATPALALCAAALKARTQTDE